MIDLYFAPTPNGWKITIMLEECGLAHKIVPLDIGSGEQFSEQFLAISPNNRMPAIVDNEHADGPLAIFESGAILIYLANKSGQFLPSPESREYYDVMQWLFWQMAGLGPMAGQVSHFVNYAPEASNEYARTRYRNEYDRLLGVMDQRLRDREFLAGDYTIADMAAFPWILPYKRYEQDLDKFTHLRRWFDTVKERPAVRRGVDVGKDWRPTTDKGIDDKTRAVLFNQTSESLRGGD
ncbi:MAG: glutathione S-transferase family protein [Pseudomonadales bacterium]